MCIAIYISRRMAFMHTHMCIVVYLSLLHTVMSCYISRRVASMNTLFIWHAVYCYYFFSWVAGVHTAQYIPVLLFLCSKSGCCVLCTMHCLHRTHVAFSPSIFLSVRPPEAYRLIPPSPDSTLFLIPSSLLFLIPLPHFFIFLNILSSFAISFSFS